MVEECLKNLTDTENSLIFSEKILVSPRGVILGRFSGSSGGCIAGKTEWFRKIRGFDEVYTGFSFEDRDIIHRARLDRLKVIDIFDKVKILHQCHRGRKGKNENYLKQKEYYINNRSVIRNLEKWGEVVN
ncbi:MAG: hypothetical protein KKH94_11315 [Candidatus Omnitrophica bacterium]|nr:hypothetical protein [Candidatus Omnitrophota bacterium]